MRLRISALCLCLGVLSQAALPPGAPVADVPILALDGKKIDLKQYRGKPVIVAMISLTCGHCINAVQALNDLQKDYGSRGLQVVGVAGDENASEALPPWITRFRPNYPFGYLGKVPFLKLAGLPPDARPFVPIVMFIDPKGMVRLRYLGNDKEMKNTVAALVDGTKQLLGESMPFVRK